MSWTEGVIGTPAIERLPPWSIFRLGKSLPVVMIGEVFSRGADKEEIHTMAVRPLIFGVLFIAVFVLVILSIIGVDKSHPIHQPDPLAPTAPANSSQPTQ